MSSIHFLDLRLCEPEESIDLKPNLIAPDVHTCLSVGLSKHRLARQAELGEMRNNFLRQLPEKQANLRWIKFTSFLCEYSHSISP